MKPRRRQKKRAKSRSQETDPKIIAYNRTYCELKVRLPGNIKAYTYYGVLPDVYDRLERMLKYGQLKKFYRTLKAFSNTKLHRVLNPKKEHN